jgi:hypothetical protein
MGKPMRIDAAGVPVHRSCDTDTSIGGCESVV